jgi:plasmid stabilization system protein ParE
MRRLVVRKQAEIEIAAAIDWYQKQNPVAAQNFATAVEHVLKAIQENPFHYQVIEAEIRRAVMSTFPYRLIYLVTDTDVAVISCLRTSRDPEAWRDPGQ